MNLRQMKHLEKRQNKSTLRKTFLLSENAAGHTMAMFFAQMKKRIHHQSFKWTPHGNRTWGRPKETLRRTIHREMKSMYINNFHQLQQLVFDRQNWRVMTSALCANFSTRGK
jgi:hypothetical protein